MRTVAGIVLAVLLVAAIIFGVVMHGKYSDTRDALLISEKNSSELNGKVTLLTEEVSSLSEKLREREGVLTELEKAQTRISELEDALKMKDGRIAELQEELRLVKGDLEKERKAEETLRNELSAKETVAAELQEKSDLKGEKASAESKVGRLQTTYDALIADLKEQIEKREVTIEAFEKRISVSFVDRILFDFGKETVTPEGREVLEKVGGILKDVQDRQIRVIGHTDDIPILPEYRYRFPSNWELSAARAAAVVRHFERETGLDPRNLEAVGRSFYHPVASNETADGRSQNRRVEIIIAPKFK
jgi:chemotaxis protein MotB